MTQYRKDPKQLELDLEGDGVFDTANSLPSSYTLTASQYPPSKDIVDRNIVSGYDLRKWVGEVEELCEQYPALEIAYKNFEMVLRMVKKDYDEEDNND